MPVKMLIDKLKIRYKVHSAWKNALPILSEEILNDCNEYCKMDTGALIASSYTHSKFKKGKLIWQTPYAKRQYWEIKTAITDNGKPKATWKWCEVAKKNHFEQWKRQADVLFNTSLKNSGVSLPGGGEE